MKKINTQFEWNSITEIITIEVKKSKWLIYDSTTSPSGIKEAMNNSLNQKTNCEESTKLKSN